MTTIGVLLLLLGLAAGFAAGLLVARSGSESSGEGLTEATLRSLDQAHDRMLEVAPLRQTIERVESQLAALRQQRAGADAALVQQVADVRATSESLRRETATLVTALRRPQTRGRWGEMQLRNVVEAAGLIDHVDFEEQVRVADDDGARRPDLVVHLAGGKHVVVDAKVPLDAYLSAIDAREAGNEAGQAERLVAHARQLRAHVDALASKRYWSSIGPTPEFVVLFLPGESFLSEALAADPRLLDHAFGQQVVLATPTTLVALLRTVGYAWSQAALADNAREVFDLGRELYARLATLGAHVDKVGRSLKGAVGAYNDAVGSLEGRVLVTARRLADLGVTSEELAGPAQVEASPRITSAPELRGRGSAA